MGKHLKPLEAHRLSPVEFRVLWCLLQMLREKQNDVTMDQLATRCQLPSVTVSRALKALHRKKAILKRNGTDLYEIHTTL